MSETEIRKEKLSGVSKARVQKRVKQGQYYIETKKVVIKDNSTRQAQKGQETPRKVETGRGRDPVTGQKRAKEEKPKLQGISTKRLRSENSTPPADLRTRKKTGTEGLTFTRGRFFDEDRRGKPRLP
ncbi:hypothetical protein JTB14_029679 [Gonioctena quinquepunctata]|nr:hypothetical protein JTB14_029679 [Gonioctena quinquepunctata]